MRWGNVFVCANRFTFRQCIEQTTVKTTIRTTYKLYRPQRLEIVRIFLLPDTDTASKNDEETGPSYWCKPSNVLQSTLRLIHKLGAKWLVVLFGGWVMWASAIILSILANCWLAVAYLAALPLTGLVVRTFFGHRARYLYNREPSNYTRMAVIVENFNDANWTVLIGNSNLVDSILNKALVRVDEKDVLHWVDSSRHRSALRFVLRVLIAVQWGVILGASALQGWDAIIISIFIVISACASTFIFSTRDSIAGWLHSNGVALEKMRVVFSSRRSMLSTMIVLNPDPRTSWLDPILGPSDYRTRWETVLEETSTSGNEPRGKEPWKSKREWRWQHRLINGCRNASKNTAPPSSADASYVVHLICLPRLFILASK
jgi:hypothetical protein